MKIFTLITVLGLVFPVTFADDRAMATVTATAIVTVEGAAGIFA